MKTTGFISMIAAALTLSLTYVSCDKDDTKDAQPQDNNNTTVVKAFLPDTYADKTVAAWYSIYSEADYKTKIEAVFLFTDSTLAVTKSKVYTEEDGRDPSRVVMYEGKYEVNEGDFNNGIFIFTFTAGSAFNIEITDGQLTFMGQTYAKQDNSKVPAPTKTTENEFIGTVQPYLPAFTIEINYAAWYTSTTQETNRIKIDAIFLNTDSLMLYTRSRFYTQKDGRKPSYEVIDIGTYKLTEGDYTTGMATLKLSTGEVYDAIITDGQMSVMDVVFTKQDNDKLPEPVKE
jgi:hypothetical protein